MNGAHLHLLVNHLPIIGAFLTLPLLALALVRRHDRGLLLAATLTLAIVGVGALAALNTGEQAEEVVEHLPGFSEQTIELHEERAEIAAIVAVVSAVGGLSLLGLAWRRDGPVPSLWLAALLAATLATSGTMAWTGQAGGVIRHTEIRDGGPPAATDAGQRMEDDSDAH
jgi:hypothetical protein